MSTLPKSLFCCQGGRMCACKSHPNCVRATWTWGGAKRAHHRLACPFKYSPESNRWFTSTNILASMLYRSSPIKQTPRECPPSFVTANKILVYICLGCVIYKAFMKWLSHLINTATPSYKHYMVIFHLKKLRPGEVRELRRAMQLMARVRAASGTQAFPPPGGCSTELWLTIPKTTTRNLCYFERKKIKRRTIIATVSLDPTHWMKVNHRPFCSE